MQILSSDYPVVIKQPLTLKYLFLKFFKIGMVSFGGYMALVAMIQRELVEKDGVIEPETITDGISIASLLPGPLAVNIVAYVGYHAKKKLGAFVAVAAVLLPATIAMLILSWCYFNYGYKSHWNQVLFYTTGTVSGIILTTGIQIYKKDVKGNLVKNTLCIISFLFIIWLNSYLVTLGLILTGGLAGFFLKLHNPLYIPDNEGKGGLRLLFNWKMKIATLLLAFIALTYVLNLEQIFQNIYLKISLVFSGISLSLFGGGYVMIPIMQSMLVSNLKWVSGQEFLDCIAFSQLTPGPILVSSVFIGYKLTGLAGAIVALVATFAPSAILMILVSKIFAVHKESTWLRNSMAGIKAVVVGLIIASAYKLLHAVPINISVIIICALTFFISLKYKVSPVYLILASLVIGICLTFSPILK
ncbi:chromate efflux transporter [Mucilaginibacter sp. X5P1]|uniref:chromate efflux transporter n=1 Tax=Mucilaginibacter sp. X5P1 TaxID=2723088 RepID=UPI001607A7ED|nr:chromate efflux transporter [Mucilaginibacter sp. X5P1]MBB6138623.1 chromate transporter [Mucilaginibacter sp. X5P1]